MFLTSWGRRHFIAALLAGWTAAAIGAAAKPAILVLGDSISAEYGLKRGTGWVPLLQRRLAAQRLPFDVVNASISGDTTSGGRSRLTALLAQHHPAVVVIELGANDALRGLPLQMTEDNLNQMAADARRAGARVLLLGMQMPPNYGADYGKRFAGLYQKVAKAQQAGLVPFLLKGVADVPDAARWFQADGLHPTEEAQPRLLENVWPELRKILATMTAARASRP